MNEGVSTGTAPHRSPTDDATSSKGLDAEAAEAAQPAFEETLIEEARALVADAKIYAEAEFGFQKLRAGIAGRLVGTALVAVIVALVLLHIAFLALAVGLVLAITEVLGVWWSIAIVVGGTLGLVGLLGWYAFANGQKLAALFKADGKTEADNDGEPSA